MTIINVRNKQVDVDIEAELREYSWDRDRWTSDKLIACSPFRHDSNPSFFVSLETGGWGDSGSVGDYASGNLFDLLAYLRGTDTLEVCDYLIDKYGALYDITDDSNGIKIKPPSLRKQDGGIKEIDGEHVVQATSPYMIRRGISAEVQRQFGVGYGEGHKGFTALPWYTAGGRLANIKYRSTGTKRFFYESNATAVSTLVYGLDVARGYDEVVIVEGEVDALSWWVAGIPAVAIGGAHISNEQIQAILREGFLTIYAAGDNDKQGDKLNGMIEKAFRGKAEIRGIDYGKEKDANDVLLNRGVQGLLDAFIDAEEVMVLRLSI